MAEEDFNQEKILSLEDIFKVILLKNDEVIAEAISLKHKTEKAYAEIIRRDENEDEYNEAICKLEKVTTIKVLNVLRKSIGPLGFNNIRRGVGCSPTTLANALRELVDEGLVRRVEGRYQASSPAWFVQKKRGKF